MDDLTPTLRRDVAQRGFALLRSPGPELAPEEATRSPWLFAERLLGARPRLVERQPIKPVPGGRSFASNSASTPLHSDSQLFAGAPPGVQVMACLRPAASGGESVLLDTWALLDRIRAADASLYRLLFEAPRRIPFVFGDVFGPTVAARGGSLAFTHSPMNAGGDPVAARLAPWIAAAPLVEVGVAAREILVVDNHRMLHGRRGFAGGDREFVRLLVWLPEAIAAHPTHLAIAAEVAARTARRLEGAPEAVRRRLGFGEAPAPEASRRLGIVLEMLRGVPPGVLSARERIAEPELYRMRDAALAAAEKALGAATAPGSDEEVESALAAGRR
jgi:hypothetical protein